MRRELGAAGELSARDGVLTLVKDRERKGRWGGRVLAHSVDPVV